jgi:hypothetical protein
MGKRYVFWPAPDGKPYKGADGKFAPAALLASVGTTTTINAEGALSFPSFPTTELAIRHMAIVTDENGAEINEHDAKDIIWDAVRAAIRELGGGKPIEALKLLHIADGLAAKHFRKPSEQYRLITSLSIESFPAKQVKLGDFTISPLPGRRSAYPVPEAATRGEMGRAFEEHLRSSKYQMINVDVSGRTIHEASDKALDALNLLRGLWTFFETYGS